MDQEGIQPQKVHAKSEVVLYHQKIPYMPSTITSLRTNHNRSMLAVGKETGVIEIFSYPTFASFGLHCSISSPVRSIEWIEDACKPLQIYSIILAFYLSGQISLYSIHDFRPMDSTQLPPGINIFEASCIDSQSFIVACSDGTIRKIEYYNERISQTQQTQQLDASCLSAAHLKGIIYAAFSNGFIRSFQAKTLLPQANWQLNVARKRQIAQDKKIIPWKVAVCNFHLLVATSSGSIIVYETSYNTEIQSIQTHEADILAMYSYNGTLYASGVDSKIVSLSFCNNQYSITGSSRGQSHDVLAIEILQNDKLVSGGITTDLCLYQLEKDGLFQGNTSSHRFTIPQPNHFQVSRKFLAINKFKALDLLSLSPEQDPVYHSEFNLLSPCHFIKLTNKRFAYGQSDKTTIFSLDSDNSFVKFRTLKHSKGIEFFQDSFFLIDPADKLFRYKLRGAGKFLYQLPRGQPRCFQVVNKRFLVIGYPTLQKFISVRLGDLEVQEVDCALNQNIVTNITVVRGAQIGVLVNYATHHFAFYMCAQQQWRLSKYSRVNILKNPLSYKQLRDPIKGVIVDPKDVKRQLWFSHNHLVKVHLRGNPPKDCKETNMNEVAEYEPVKKNSSLVYRKIEDVENYQLMYSSSLILGIYRFKENEHLLLEWDKDMTFAELPDAFDAKKYKK